MVTRLFDTFVDRIDPLATPLFLRVFSNCLHVRGNFGRSICLQHCQPWFQCACSYSPIHAFLKRSAVVKQPCLHGTGSYRNGLGGGLAWIIFGIFQCIWSRWGCPSGLLDCSYFPSPAYIFRRQTTASDSALVVVVAARALYMRDHPDAKLEDLVIYTTTQTHSLGSKAALVLGLRVRSIEVTLEHGFALREDALRSALESDAKIGQKPFILSAAFSNALGPK